MYYNINLCSEGVATLHSIRTQIEHKELNMETTTKICTKCNCEKTLDKFYKNKKTKDGYRVKCKKYELNK